MIQLPTELTTPRLLLRKPTIADAQAIFHSYAQDPEVTRYLIWQPHPSLATTQAYLEYCLHGWQQGHECNYAIINTATTSLVGMLSVRLQAWHAALGYVLARHAWGQGIMPEAARAMTDLLLTEPTIFRVWAICDIENSASARVMEKIGMQREGVMRRGVLHPNISSEPRDCLLYAKIK